MIRRALKAAALLAAAGLISTGAQAQLFRTYLALNGSDGNPCTLVQPCRLLPAALAAVADGGEIWMLDTANYNTSMVVVDKSVSILAAPGVVGSLVATNSNDILRIDGVGAKVALRNVVLARVPGVAGTVVAISMHDGESLVIEGCTFSNVTYGITVDAPAKVQVTDTTFRAGGYGVEIRQGASLSVARSTFTSLSSTGVRVRPISTGSVTSASVTESVFLKVNAGVVAEAGTTGYEAHATVSRSQFHDASSALVASGVTGATARLSALGNTVSNMTNAGIMASGAGAKVNASGNLVTSSNIGLRNSNGSFDSAGDNMTRDNTNNTNGTITKVVSE